MRGSRVEAQAGGNAFAYKFFDLNNSHLNNRQRYWSCCAL